MAEDHHAVLGIKSNASREEILQAYSELVKKFHPDHNHDDSDAEEKFVQIQRSFEMLYEPERHQVVGAFHTRLSALLRVHCLRGSVQRTAHSDSFRWPVVITATVFYLVLLMTILVLSSLSGPATPESGSVDELLGAYVLGISVIYLVVVVTVLLLKDRE